MTRTMEKVAPITDPDGMLNVSLPVEALVKAFVKQQRESTSEEESASSRSSGFNVPVPVATFVPVLVKYLQDMDSESQSSSSSWSPTRSKVMESLALLHDMMDHTAMVSISVPKANVVKAVDLTLENRDGDMVIKTAEDVRRFVGKLGLKITMLDMSGIIIRATWKSEQGT